MVDTSEVTSIELDTEDPFKHMIVYYNDDGKEVKRKQVPAYDSTGIFIQELSSWIKT